MNPLKKLIRAVEDLTPGRRRIKRRLAVYAGHPPKPTPKRRKRRR